MLRGRGHLPHRPSRCFPTARSQLHRLWTRRELEKTKEPRRPGSQVHSIFETVRHFSKTKLYTFLYRKKDIRIFLQVFFSIAPEKKEGISFFIWIYFSLPRKGCVLILARNTWVRVTGHLGTEMGSWQPVPPSPTPKIDGDRDSHRFERGKV